MGDVDRLELRWVDVPANGGAAPRPLPLEPIDSHDLVNSVTAVATAAGLLCDRWDELTDEQRRELAAAIRRRATDLRRLLTNS